MTEPQHAADCNSRLFNGPFGTCNCALAPVATGETGQREVLQAGYELIESAFAHVSHGGPTRADAEKWLERARKVLNGNANLP